jgi:hypothetical protein
MLAVSPSEASRDLGNVQAASKGPTNYRQRVGGMG